MQRTRLVQKYKLVSRSLANRLKASRNVYLNKIYPLLQRIDKQLSLIKNYVTYLTWLLASIGFLLLWVFGIRPFWTDNDSETLSRKEAIAIYENAGLSGTEEEANALLKRGDAASIQMLAAAGVFPTSSTIDEIFFRTFKENTTNSALGPLVWGYSNKLPAGFALLGSTFEYARSLRTNLLLVATGRRSAADFCALEQDQKVDERYISKELVVSKSNCSQLLITGRILESFANSLVLDDFLRRQSWGVPMQSINSSVEDWSSAQQISMLATTLSEAGILDWKKYNFNSTDSNSYFGAVVVSGTASLYMDGGPYVIFQFDQAFGFEFGWTSTNFTRKQVDKLFPSSLKCKGPCRAPKIYSIRVDGKFSTVWAEISDSN